MDTIIGNEEDLVCAEKCKSYTIITKINSKQIVSDIALGTLEEVLPREKFFRIHKSFIIRTTLINEVVQDGNSYYVILKNGKRVPISRRNKRMLISQLLSNYK